MIFRLQYFGINISEEKYSLYFALFKNIRVQPTSYDICLAPLWLTHARTLTRVDARRSLYTPPSVHIAGARRWREPLDGSVLLGFGPIVP